MGLAALNYGFRMYYEGVSKESGLKWGKWFRTMRKLQRVDVGSTILLRYVLTHEDVSRFRGAGRCNMRCTVIYVRQ